MDCAPGFEELLQPLPIESLDRDGCVFGLWPDLTLACFNDGWRQFAAENGGQQQVARWTLGRSVLDAVSGPLRPFYAAAYRECLNGRSSWEHAYECSSPDRYRQFHLTTHVLGERQGLLVVNSLSVEAPHDPLERRPHQPVESMYRDARGLVHQCSHCRKVRRVVGAETWDWVPQWVRRCPSGTSHGLCSICLGYYYSR